MRQLLIIAAFLLFGFVSKAALTSVSLLPPQTITASTNSGNPVAIGTIILPSTTYSIQNTGLSNTNTLAVDISIGFSTNSMTVVGTYIPSTTNATADSFLLTNSSVIPIYAKATARVMTNSATVVIQAIQQR